MTSKHVDVFAGTVLGGILLLGTAGLVLAQDPIPTPGSAGMPGMSGGMVGGQGMMGGQAMMGGAMDPGQMPDMTAMHQTMAQSGTCDPELMQSMHERYHPTR